MLKFCLKCIKMGIPSLKSAILYCVSLYFHSNYANITNIPDPVHKNRPFHGREAQFSFPIHENEHFHGWEMKFGIGTFMHHVLFNE